MFNEVEKIWSDGSKDYDKVIQAQLKNKKDVEHWKNELYLALNKGKNLNVMDVGCGPGFFSIMLHRLGYKVTSVDGAEGMVKQASNNFKVEGANINIYQGDVTKLEKEKENSLDAIVSRDVVWTLYDPERAFKRWYSILKPGGRIVIFDANYHYKQISIIKTLWRYVANFLILITEARVRREKKTILQDLPFCKVKRPETDIELLKAAGFNIISVKDDKYRDSGLAYIKYTWQGKHFKIVAEKPCN